MLFESVREVMFFLAKVEGANHGQDLFAKLSGQEIYSKYSQVAFLEKVEWSAKDLRFAAERGRRGQKIRELKHERDEDVQTGKREELRDVSRCDGPFTAAR